MSKYPRLALLLCIIIVVCAFLIDNVFEYFEDKRSIMIKAYKGLDEMDPDDQPEAEEGTNEPLFRLL